MPDAVTVQQRPESLVATAACFGSEKRPKRQLSSVEKTPLRLTTEETSGPATRHRTSLVEFPSPLLLVEDR